MATFAVNASEEQTKKFYELMEKMGADGEKKAETLEKIFRIAADQANGETMKSGGVDVAALDAAQENIRNLFLAAVGGREEIQAQAKREIEEIKAKKDELEADLRGQIAEAKAAREEAEKAAIIAAEKASQAEKEAKAAEETAQAKSDLVAEKDKTILSLTDKLTVAESKVEKYDDLAAKEAEARQENKEIRAEMDRKLSEAQKDAEIANQKALRELAAKEAEATDQINKIKAELEQKLSDTKKDAEIAKEKALRAVEIENAKLKTIIEMLKSADQKKEKEAVNQNPGGEKTEKSPNPKK